MSQGMGVNKLVSAAAGLLLLSACGVSSATSGGKSPSPRASATPTAAVLIITDRDSHRSFELALTDSALLQLSHTQRWSDPIVQGSAVRLQALQDRTWRIVPIQPGEVTITSTGTADCPPGSACPMYAILFTVTIDVR